MRWARQGREAAKRTLDAPKHSGKIDVRSGAFGVTPEREMAGERPRRHHYLPRFYLAGFTDSGQRDGRLHVISLQDGHRLIGTPESVGHQRDFYRLDGVEDGAFELEHAFAEIEGGAATAIRSTINNRQLPADDELFSYLINFVALMAARVPQTRENFARPLRRVWEMLLEIELSSRERFEALVQQARAAGEQIPDVDYKHLRQSFREGRIVLEVSQAQHIQTLLHAAETLVPLLAARHWRLLFATGAEFITSDHPVALTWTVPRPPSFYGPGFGIAGTDVTLPLTKSIALLGRLEPQQHDTIELDQRGVASLNSRTGMYAGRIVISGNPDHVWERADHTIGNADQLVEAIRREPRRPD